MILLDSESIAHRIVAWIDRTAPRFLSEAANRWRWEWKAAFGTLHPVGVFVLAAYLAFFLMLFVAGRVIRRALRSTPIE